MAYYRIFKNALRKFAAISFLVLLLFNFVGYRVLFSVLQQKSLIHFEADLDKGEYDASELITLKVPLSMPYLSDWGEFRRVDGEINFEGRHYRYVMRKVEKGQLVLRCLPDPNRTILENGSNEYAVHSNDLAPAAPSKKAADTFKKSGLSSEYEGVFHPSLKKLLFSGRERHAVSFLSPLTGCFLPSPDKPPESSLC